MPSITLGVVGAGYYARLVHSNMVEVLNQDYIRAALARGLSEPVVLFKHALRNALIPVLTVLGMDVAGLLAGVVFTESIFALPGLGAAMSLQAVQTLDVPMIMGTVLFAAVLVVAAGQHYGGSGISVGGPSRIQHKLKGGYGGWWIVVGKETGNRNAFPSSIHHPPSTMMMALLNVQNLSVRFTLGRQSFFAVERASFTLNEGRTLALVGESGCGKTSIALALLERLVPPQAKIEADSIALRGRELTHLTEREMCAVRGKDAAMVFQDPLTALNPVYTVGEQIAEGLRLHGKLGRRAAWERAVEAMSEVGIPDARQRAREYPHQLSGGLRQRVTVAQAIACRPPLLIADEPTTALDVSLQAQIIDLLLKLQAGLRLSILRLITHDLGVVAGDGP